MLEICKAGDASSANIAVGAGSASVVQELSTRECAVANANAASDQSSRLWRMCGTRMVIVQVDCERICDDAVIDGSRKQHFLGVARQLRPHLQRCVPEQGSVLVFVHLQILGRSGKQIARGRPQISLRPNPAKLGS
jgi:hypothetical protein